eukprot:1159133-Pelagomonas_calceolata.AAC.3
MTARLKHSLGVHGQTAYLFLAPQWYCYADTSCVLACDVGDKDPRPGENSCAATGAPELHTYAFGQYVVCVAKRHSSDHRTLWEYVSRQVLSSLKRSGGFSGCVSGERKFWWTVNKNPWPLAHNIKCITRAPELQPCPLTLVLCFMHIKTRRAFAEKYRHGPLGTDALDYYNARVMYTRATITGVLTSGPAKHCLAVVSIKVCTKPKVELIETLLAQVWAFKRDREGCA